MADPVIPKFEDTQPVAAPATVPKFEDTQPVPQFDQTQPVAAQAAPGVLESISQDFQQSQLGNAAKYGIQKAISNVADLGDRFPALEGVRGLGQAIKLAKATRVSEDLKPTEGFSPTTGTEQTISTLIREIPALASTGIAAVPAVAQGVAKLGSRFGLEALTKSSPRLASALEAYATTVASAPIEGLAGSVARQAQDYKINIGEALRDTASATGFAMLLGVPIAGGAAITQPWRAGKAAQTAARQERLRIGAEGEIPKPDLFKAEASPRVSDEMQMALDSTLSEQARMNTALKKEAERLKVKVEGIRSIPGKEVDITDTLAQRAATLEDDVSQKVAQIENDFKVFSENPADQIKLAEKQSVLEGRKFELQQQLDELKLQPEPIEVRAPRQQSLQAKIDDINSSIEDIKIQGSPDSFTAKKLKLREKTDLRIQQAIADRDSQLGKVSDRLNIEQSRLKSQRDSLVSQLKEATADDSNFKTLQNKLKANLEQQKLIQDTRSNFSFEVNKGKVGQGLGVQNTQEELLDVALQQVKKVDDALDKKLIRPEVADQLRRAEWENALRVQGVDPGAAALTEPTVFGQFLNETTRNNLVQKRTGARTGEVIEKTIAGNNQATNYIAQKTSEIEPIIQGLNKLGISDDEATRLLQYYEWTPDGQVQFTPTPFKSATPDGKVKIDVPVYNGPDLLNPQNAEVDGLMKQVAQFYRQEGQANGVPLLNRFVPLRQKVVPTGTPRGSKVTDIVDPTLTRERVSGKFDPATHETNIRKLTSRYLRESSRNQFLSPVLNEGIDELNKLRIMGNFKDAENFKKSLIRGFGLNDEKDIAAIFGQQFIKQNPEVIDALVKAAPNKETALREIHDAATSAMYNNLVGTNPITWIQQYFQPEVVGTAEVGLRNIQAAKRLRFTNPELLKEAKALVNLSLTHDLQLLDTAVSSPPSSRVAKGLEFINKPSETISKRTMGKLELRNRELSMIAAGEQWRGALNKNGIQGLDTVLSDLTTSERSLIRKTMKDGGLEEARKMYQVIRTRRINFAYSAADKPEILAEGLGKYIPFTTFSRNMVNRIIEDASEKNFGKLTQRVLYPIIAMGIVGKLTGRVLPGTNPIDQAANLATSITPFPQYTQPILKAKERGIGAGLLKGAEILTPVGPAKRVYQLATGEKKLLPTPEENARYSATERLLNGFKR